MIVIFIHSFFHLRVATYLQGSSTFMDVNSTAIVLEMITAPGWTVLNNITVSSFYSRIKTTYVLDFTTSKYIPATSNFGSLVVRFPSGYALPDTTSQTCSTTTTSYASSLSCYSTSNNLTVLGNTAKYNGNLKLTLSKIKNPTLEGAVNNIHVFLYDGYKKSILERSYWNLDPISNSFTYKGPLITVNNGNPVIIDGGTVSDYIYMTLNYPSALELTIKATSSGSLTLLPSNVILTLGAVKAVFRVSVP